MSEQPQIWLGDALRAFHGLALQDEPTRRAVAALLGLQWPETTPAPIPIPTPTPPDPPISPSPTLQIPPTPTHPSTRSAGTRHTPIQELPAVPIRLTPAGGRTSLPDWFGEVPAASLPEDEPLRPLPLDPLLRPGWTRSILHALLATPSLDGAVDTATLIRRVVRAEPVRDLPRLPRLHLRRGVQLLMDRSAAMAPFARDEDLLAAQVARMVDGDAVQILAFAGCPTRGAGTGERDSWTAYRPPRRGTPVLLLTDLGIGRSPANDESASPREWRRFTWLLREAGCRATALVPYAPYRWPELLRPLMTILPWDQTTTFRMAATARRAGNSKSQTPNPKSQTPNVLR